MCVCVSKRERERERERLREIEGGKERVCTHIYTHVHTNTHRHTRTHTHYIHMPHKKEEQYLPHPEHKSRHPSHPEF